MNSFLIYNLVDSALDMMESDMKRKLHRFDPNEIRKWRSFREIRWFSGASALDGRIEDIIGDRIYITERSQRTAGYHLLVPSNKVGSSRISAIISAINWVNWL